jgi:AcrR family transcriptional regulator
MESLIARKKEEKRRNLLDAAYDLFMNQGISSTTIAEICAKAGIAKGTFYLYFRDKEDILSALTKRMSYTILKNAYHLLDTRKDKGFVENLITMADYLMDYFAQDTGIMQVLQNDFTWPITEQEFLETDDPVMSLIRQRIARYASLSGLSEHQILIRLYALLTMIASVCYSCLIDHFPEDLSEIRPEIDALIRGAFPHP